MIREFDSWLLFLNNYVGNWVGKYGKSSVRPHPKNVAQTKLEIMEEIKSVVIASHAYV